MILPGMWNGLERWISFSLQDTYPSNKHQHSAKYNFVKLFLCSFLWNCPFFCGNSNVFSRFCSQCYCNHLCAIWNKLDTLFSNSELQLPLLFPRDSFASFTLFMKSYNLRWWRVFYTLKFCRIFNYLWCLKIFSLCYIVQQKRKTHHICNGVGFLLVRAQSKQETGSGVIAKCFEEEQKLLLLHCTRLWNGIVHKISDWLRETEPKRDSNNRW